MYDPTENNPPRAAGCFWPIGFLGIVLGPFWLTPRVMRWFFDKEILERGGAPSWIVGIIVYGVCLYLSLIVVGLVMKVLVRGRFFMHRSDW